MARDGGGLCGVGVDGGGVGIGGGGILINQ
jgi:hypothetical protein